MADTEASKVFTEQLFTKGQGLPLWDPTPPQEVGEVQIGDVGYIWRGAFHRLFNAMHDADDEINRRFGVPEGFTKFTIAENRRAISRRENAIPGGFLCSKNLSVNQYSVQGGTPQNAPGGASVGASFSCQEEHAAVLWMRDPADREELHRSRRMANYMGSNFKKWHTFAVDSVDVDIPKDALYFVRGWVKTRQWAVAAVLREGRSRSFSLTASFASAGISMSLDQSREIQGNVEFNQGPPLRAARSPYPSITDSQESVPLPQPYYEIPRNQTVFLHYYKLKPRSLWMWKAKIEAAADPQDPTPDRDNSRDMSVRVESAEGESEGDIVDDLLSRKNFDPLDFLLNYILEHSEAEVAIANDDDLISLCKDRDIPNDIPEFLKQIMPPVEVTTDGLGMVLHEDFSLDPAEAGAIEVEEQIPFDEHAHSDRDTHAPHGSSSDVDSEDPTKKGSTNDRSFTLTEDGLGVTSLEFSRDGRYLATALEDYSITTWELANQRRMSSCQGHTEPIYSMAFSARANEMVSGGGDGLAIVWDTVNGTERTRLTGHDGVVWSVAYSPDGKTIATSSVDFTVRLWEAESGEQKALCRGHTAVVLTVTFSPDGKRVASGSSDYTARIWNATNGADLTVLKGHFGVVWTAAFSPDSSRIVTGSDDRTSRVWNVLTGEELVHIGEHEGPVWNVGFSPDGLRVYSASTDSTIKVCDSYSGDCAVTLGGNDISANTAAFSPDGTRIASTCDNDVKIWDSTNGSCIATLVGHSDTITNLRFSPGGDCLASSSDDFTVRVWDLV
ncbi:WD40 repeat-like protein [Obba rivulosa]|uniref:WD40 repeat-like protein n=1 Tax=Obba rivulosa TaxID=1052685 RepID=A0A8E2J2F8_9APHY|nr:WD40 repeat-like protein [Obba rivulosa]